MTGTSAKTRYKVTPEAEESNIFNLGALADFDAVVNLSPSVDAAPACESKVSRVSFSE